MIFLKFLIITTPLLAKWRMCSFSITSNDWCHILLKKNWVSNKEAVRYSTHVLQYTSQACIVYRLGKLNIASCIGNDKSDSKRGKKNTLFLTPSLPCTSHPLLVSLPDQYGWGMVGVWLWSIWDRNQMLIATSQQHWSGFLHSCVLCIDSCIAILLAYRLVYRLGQEILDIAQPLVSNRSPTHSPGLTLVVVAPVVVKCSVVAPVVAMCCVLPVVAMCSVLPPVSLVLVVVLVGGGRAAPRFNPFSS